MSAGVLPSWLSRRADTRFGTAGLALWYLCGAATVLLLPSLLWLRVPYWSLSGDLQLELAIWTAVFAALSVAVLVRVRQARPLVGLLLVAAAWGGGYAALVLTVGGSNSRGLALVSMVIGSLLLLLPWVLVPTAALLAPLVPATAVIAGLWGERLAASAPPGDHIQATARVALAMDYQDGLFPVEDNRGGAIAAVDNGFLVVDAAGHFRRMDWDADTRDLLPRPLSLTPPLNLDEFLADQPPELPPMDFRVTDLLVDARETPARIYVAHQYWNREGQCLTVRVSAAPITATADPTPWQLVYETRPCLPRGSTVHYNQTGGQLAWSPAGELLLTVGDHGYDGVYGDAYAQDPGVDYGKVLILDLAGGASWLTRGHRNPQGLLVDTAGRIWEAEQGPKGGDEVNVIEAGRNYGWPLVTYGTEYEGLTWPLGADRGHHGGFAEPVHVFVPSLAVSSLLQVGPGRFAPWQGDLLLGSLRGETLLRLHTRGAEVAYAEPIPVGLRVRDLAQGRDGRIVLWTDEGVLVVLDTASRASDGAAVYAACSGCHGPNLEGTALGPDLRGLLGRPVASRVGFPYSPAIRRLQGRWTSERLDLFLANPGRYLPGTSMASAGIRDTTSRWALIEFLRRAPR